MYDNVAYIEHDYDSLRACQQRLGKNGSPNCRSVTHGNVIDMTDDKDLNIELQSVLDTHTDPFIIIDDNYNIVAANAAYCEAYNRPREFVIGSKCHQISHKCDEPCNMHGEDCPLQNIMQGQDRHEALHIHHDNCEHTEHVRVTGYRITDSSGKRYIGERITRIAGPSASEGPESALKGQSKTFLGYINRAVSMAGNDDNLLIRGESGVGKNNTAEFIHQRSRRSDYPFITLNCAMINSHFMGSELFGHEQRAFPGCSGRRRGLIDDAYGGTLYLDEVGDLPPDLQARLLHFIETGEYSRVGGTEVLKSDVRIIASSNSDIEKMIESNRFRADLYYRLAENTLYIPALRERLGDVSILADHFLAQSSAQLNRAFRLTGEAYNLLRTYNYPGNIRELKNILMQACSMNDGELIHARSINMGKPGLESLGTEFDADESFSRSIRTLEAQRISETLKANRGNRRKAARELGISERTLYRKLEKYDLNTAG